VETVGHYHRTIVARLVADGHDVVELGGEVFVHSPTGADRRDFTGLSTSVCTRPAPRLHTEDTGPSTGRFGERPIQA
jgi:hypothetical protein